MTTNERPTYTATPSRTWATNSTKGGRLVPNRFDVWEHRDGQDEFICHVGTRDTLQQLLKRGIPTEDATKLAKQIER